MAYTEKVLLSGTALSFLFYECVNSGNSQEGFLIGDVTSEITNHISDTQSDNTRLDTQINIRTVLPLPSVSLFYLPTGRIKEDILSDMLASTASEIVGWYKYRKNANIKPTFRDKLISKGLQKYFEKHHGKKNFVSCNISNKASSSGSTHTFMYRFGKINCFDMYEYIEDVTANLGEKYTGYKKAHKSPPHSIFSKIVKDSKVQVNNTSDAILTIQEAVDAKLVKEAKIAAKNECTIRELEAEIKQMATILSDKQSFELQSTYNKYMEEKAMNREAEMAKACLEALKIPLKVDILNAKNVPRNSNNMDSEDSVQLIENVTGLSPSLLQASSSKQGLNYAAALKNKTETASTSMMKGRGLLLLQKAMVANLHEPENSGMELEPDQNLTTPSTSTKGMNEISKTVELEKSPLPIQLPSTYPQVRPSYYISPVNSDGSDFDDSDADPHFNLPTKEGTRRQTVTNSRKTSRSSSSISSFSSSSDSSSSSSSSNSEIGNNSVPSAELNTANVSHNNVEASTSQPNANQLAATSDLRRCRKRLRNPTAWALNVKKALRNTGKAYVSSTKKRVLERTVKPPCTDK